MSSRKALDSFSALLGLDLTAACLLFLIAFAVRTYHVQTNTFDGLYGQDAYAYYNYARELFDSLTRLQSPPAFWWPLGYPALLSFSFLIGGVSITSAQMITIVCGALVAPLAYALAVASTTRPDTRIAGWVAGLLCALGGQLVQSSIVVMADAPALMWATFGAWLLVRYARTGRALELCIASFAVGMSVWTRWQNLWFALVWLVTLAAIQYKISSAPAEKNMSGVIKAWLPLLGALAIIVLVLSPQLVLYSNTNAPLAGSSWLEGWSPLNFPARSFDTVDGHFDYVLPVALFYAQVVAHPAYLFVLALPLLVAGVIILVRQFRALPHVTILLLGWSSGMYFFLAGIPYENFRFGLGLFVPLCVMAGLGAEHLAHRWRTSRLRWGLVAWIGITLLVMLFWQARVVEPVLNTKAGELSQLGDLRRQVPESAHVWTLGFTGPLNTYTSIKARDLWQVTPQEIRRTAPSYLYIDVQSIETQWRGHEPFDLYHALVRAGSLEPLTRIGNWTLFRIQ